MGMAIDEVIRRIDDYNYKCRGKICPSEGLDMIVEIIQKYQKIVDIVTDDYGYPSNLRKIMDIREVLEDGKID